MTKKLVWITRIVIAGLLVFIFLRLLINRKAQTCVSVESPARIVMNTVARIIAVAPDKKTAELSVNAAFEKIYQLEKLMNRYDPNSQLSRVNLLAANQSVQVDKDLFGCLQQSIQYSELSDGAFDITVGPLIDLWRKSAEANSTPTQRQLAIAKKMIGYEKLLLDSNDFSVRFAAEGMKLDLGAIAKGFAADRAIEEMKKAGAIGGLIDLGGQIGCFGLTEKKGKWVIGLRNPIKSENNRIIAKVAISDMAVSTSGDYERFYKIGEKQFSHIFNPATERSARELTSVTIISPNGAQADALATAINVLGAKNGLDLIEKTENTEAILIKSGSSEIIKSSRVEQYLAN